MAETILAFLKIGKLKHITDMYENGTIYLNTLSYFKKIEDGELRGDPNECAIHIVNAKNGTFKIPSLSDREFNFLKARYGTFLKTGNLLSLYCISSKGFPNPEDFKIDIRNFKFGSHFLMIKQPKIFLDRIEAELNRLEYNFEHGFVNYYEPKTVQEDLTPFDKLNVYEYQKEFRFFIENDKNESLTLNIGSMKSYSQIFETKDLPTLKLTL
jgi:hypothetical protein